MARLSPALFALLSLAAFAGPKENVAQTAAVIDQVAGAQLTPIAASNRIGFLGTEAWATDALCEKLRRSTDAKVRALLVETLSLVAVPSEDAEAFFVRYVRDEDVGLRVTAVRGLGRTKSTRQLAVIEAALKDKAYGVRREAARALGNIASPHSGSPLMAAAKAEDEVDTRAIMLVAAGRCGDKKQVSALEPFLEQTSESARLAAAQALLVLGSAKGREFAKKLLAAEDANVRLQGVLLFEGAPRQLATDVLTAVLDDKNPRVRANAGRVLYQSGDTSRLGWLVNESAKAEGELKLPYETELEKLRLTDEQRAALLHAKGKGTK